MRHAVPKIRREDLPELGLLEDETDRTRGMVGPVFQLLVQPYQMLLQLGFKLEGVVGVPLLPPAAEILPAGCLDERADCSTTVSGSCVVIVNVKTEKRSASNGLSVRLAARSVNRCSQTDGSVGGPGLRKRRGGTCAWSSCRTGKPCIVRFLTAPSKEREHESPLLF